MSHSERELRASQLVTDETVQSEARGRGRLGAQWFGWNNWVLHSQRTPAQLILYVEKMRKLEIGSGHECTMGDVSRCRERIDPQRRPRCTLATWVQIHNMNCVQVIYKYNTNHREQTEQQPKFDWKLKREHPQSPRTVLLGAATLREFSKIFIEKYPIKILLRIYEWITIN